MRDQGTQDGVRTEDGRQRSSGAAPDSVAVHIEELVLHGFAPGDRYRIGEAVERELARLLGEYGFPAPEESRHREFAAASIRLAARQRPQRTGGQIAASVYDAIVRGGESISNPDAKPR